MQIFVFNRKTNQSWKSNIQMKNLMERIHIMNQVDFEISLIEMVKFYLFVYIYYLE